MGIASVILGVLAFLVCWIPLLGMLGIPLSGLGVLLGIIGLVVAIVRKGSGVGYPIAGTAVGGLALLIGLAQVLAFGAAGSAVATVADSIVEEQEKANRTNQTVVAGDTSSGVPSRAGEGAADEHGEQWASASNPVRQGDIQVSILNTRVGKIRLKEAITNDEATSADSLLKIEVEVRNLSRNRKANYKTFSGADFSMGRDFASLRDNFDNGYKRINFGFGTEVVGSTEAGSIYPGKSIKDVLVFEEPIDTADYLNLELPAKNFGGEGMLRIRIPARMIEWN